MKSMLQSIEKLIKKEPKEVTESLRLLLVLRLEFLVQFAYSIWLISVSACICNGVALPFLISYTLVFAGLFVLSYYAPVLRTAWIYFVLDFFWIIGLVYNTGWNVGSQLFIVHLFVLVFFFGYKNVATRLTIAVILLALREWLYLTCRRMSPPMQFNDEISNIVQMVNAFVLFLCIGIVSYIYSTQLQKAEARLVENNFALQNVANTDKLTGLYNRHKGTEYLKELTQKGAGIGFTLAMLDVDFFKKVNDTYGHEIGDLVLKELAATMKRLFTNNAMLIRWGGEEFLIIQTECNGDEAHAKLAEFTDAVRNLTFQAGDVEFHITVTIGMEEYDFVSDMKTVVRLADEKLYKGKENGRNQIVF